MSEEGEWVRWRLLGRGFEERDVVAGAFLSHGSVLAMVVGIERLSSIGNGELVEDEVNALPISWLVGWFILRWIIPFQGIPLAIYRNCQSPLGFTL